MSKPASITYLRDVDGVKGFRCACGYEWFAPVKNDATHRANATDLRVSYHERTKHGRT